MMKKIILTFAFLFISCQSMVLADEIIDSKGAILPCKIETVMAGLIEYQKDGNRYFFQREETSPIFNDYIDVKQNLFKEDSVVRYFGKIYIKDMWSTIIKTENGDIDIPFYKIKFIGIYKP